MDPQEKKQFELFKEELKKYDYIDGFMVNSILNRFIYPLNKRKFFNEKLKLRYYSFWFKMLVQAGILEVRGMGYKVLK